jgi:hypothetical protein
MAPNVTVSFWAANDINGTPIHTITDEDDNFKGLTLKPDLYGLGGWELTLSRQWGYALFDDGAARMEVFVRFLVHAYSDTEWYWGGQVGKRSSDLVHRDEQGAEEFILGGPGPKQYLDRYRLGIEQNVSSDWNLDLENGVWRWAATAPAGKILRKIIAEDEAADEPTLVDMTQSFSGTLDSAGDAWANDIAGAGDYEHPIGSSLLEIIWDLEDLSDLYTTVDLGTVDDPAYLLNAWQEYGEDVAGSSFGAGVGLFREGVNIANDSLTRTGVGLRKATHVIVEGKDGAWNTAVLNSWSSGDYVKWAKIEYARSSNLNVLEAAGLRWLRRQENGDRQLEVELLPGDDETEGLYFPKPGGTIWLGNTVALDTIADGSIHSPMDYNNADQLVTALELVLGPAGDDSTTDKAAKSWDVKVKLNTERAGFAGSPNQGSASGNDGNGGGNTCKCLKLCKVHIEGDPPSEILTQEYQWNAQDNPDGEVPDVLVWTGLLPNQGPGGAGGTSNYYFKSSSPSEWAKALAQGAGVDLRISGYVAASGSNGLKVGFFNSTQVVGTDGNNANLISSEVLQAAPAPTWTFFSVDVTTPVGTASFALGKIGTSVSFDGITVESVISDPGGGGQEGDIPEPVGDEGETGTGASAARCDHTHAHGHLSIGGTHYHDPTQFEGPGAADGDVLTWNDSAEEWQPAAPAGGSSYTDEQAQDAVGGILTDTSTVDLTYNDATPSITAAVIPAGIKLDDLGTPDDNTDLNSTTSQHGLLKKLDGSASKFLDGSGNWSTPTSGGGGAVGWIQDVNQDGSSFAAWTAHVGTWASTGTIIQQTQAPTGIFRWASILQMPLGFPVIMEAEVRLPTTGQGTGADVRAGIVVGGLNASPGPTGGIGAFINCGTTNRVHFETVNVSAERTVNQTVNKDQWYKIRVAIAGFVTMWVDGTLVLGGGFSQSNNKREAIAIATFNAIADFRNIKVWIMRDGVPA